MKKIILPLLLALAFPARRCLASVGDYGTIGYDENNGNDVWRVDSSGNFHPGKDDVYSFGTDSLRIHSFNIGTGSATFSGELTVVSSLTVVGAELVKSAAPGNPVTLQVSPLNASTTGFMVNNATTGVTADLLEVKENGSEVFQVAYATGNSSVLVTALNASTTGQIVNSAASPTADVTETKIAGTVVTRIAPDGGIADYSRTTAQLLAISPAYVGERFFCSDCSPKKDVISTGTAAGNFADPAGGQFK